MIGPNTPAIAAQPPPKKASPQEYRPVSNSTPAPKTATTTKASTNEIAVSTLSPFIGHRISDKLADYTNGTLTTSARNSRSRMTTAITLPGLANSAATYPMPMPVFRHGDIVPEVTCPISLPSGVANV